MPDATHYRDRLIRILEAQRETQEDAKELSVEMKAAGLSRVEIAGVKLSAQRHFENSDRRVLRESVEQFAASLGEFGATPLGAAAVERVRRVA